jgi:hypothetical protein
MMCWPRVLIADNLMHRSETAETHNELEVKQQQAALKYKSLHESLQRRQ